MVRAAAGDAHKVRHHHVVAGRWPEVGAAWRCACGERRRGYRTVDQAAEAGGEHEASAR